MEKIFLENKHKIKIYIESGANIKFLKYFNDDCSFITFPYDSAHRRKTNPKPLLAKPSAIQWRDCHIPWSEANFPWSDFKGSEIYDDLVQLIGKSNRQDIFHLDSAHQEKVDIFLSSDKDDIWNRREQIENCNTGKK